MRKILLLALTAFTAGSLSAHSPAESRLLFEQNKGQWPGRVQFKTDLRGGRLFLESDAFTYVYYHAGDLAKAHPSVEHQAGPGPDPASLSVRCHAYRMRFAGASAAPQVSGRQQQEGYLNYFIGNDPTRWAGHVPVFAGVTYHNLYPGIDLQLSGEDLRFKYDLVVRPGSSPAAIRMEYTGLPAVALREGNLLLRTSVGDILEQRPYAYQDIDGVRREVACRYVVEGNAVTFAVSRYEHAYPLVIDPAVVASTYSGSTATTYGHCATFDDQGNIFTGGRCFGTGYPVTTGAFDVTFGGNVDIAISKLNPTGTALIYATYIGGADDEYAHSLIANVSDQLCIYGSTNSADYPTTAGCYDNTQNGFSDIIVTCLSSDGSALIGSTFIGGTGTDGQNAIPSNYGDTYKGEIITDALNNIYVASFSRSNDFPTTSGASGYSGGQDAVVLELDPTCSLLQWSTYLGGSGDDAGYGLELDGIGGVYVTGGTKSTDFPTTFSGYQPGYQGGTMDGYVAHLQIAGNVLDASSYFGTTGNDQAFFIERDADGDIYLLGQNTGAISITPGAYGNTGAKNFIVKLSADLSSVIFQTTIGTSTSSSGISPTAFLVDNCENIYMSGFGTATGYPLTPNALYSTTTIGSFYLAVLARDADSLLYGTFYGGDHVDGGTSRFDKNGIVYQGVCQGGAGFPVLPGSVGTASQASWDICVFKIDFDVSGVVASAAANPTTAGCQPFNVTFHNASNGINYLWDFGDGSAISTIRSPSHEYTDTGDYVVQLIAIDSNSCNIADTVWLTLHVAPSLPHQPTVDTLICQTPSVTLQAALSGAAYTYLWSGGSSNSSIPVFFPGTYWVQTSNGYCNVRDSFIVSKLNPPDLGPDSSLCSGQSVTLDPQGNGTSTLWSTGDTTLTLTVSQPGTYWVEVRIPGCVLRDSSDIVVLDYPVVNLGPDTLLCPGLPPAIQLDAGNSASAYSWSTGETTPVITTDHEGLYWVDAANGHCVTRDSFAVAVSLPLLAPQADTFFCDYQHAWLDAGVEQAQYLWSTGETTQRIHVVRDGDYALQVSYRTCAEYDTIHVYGSFGDELLWIPNAFSPNGDGRNDVFLPVGSDITQYECYIYNRWQQLMVHNTQLGAGWDGTVDGSRVPEGVYVYRIEYATSCSEEKALRIGTILLTY